MIVCHCVLAGTAACQHCQNNPHAAEQTQTIHNVPNLYYQYLTEDNEPNPELVKCVNCEYYIKHDKRCAVWNHGVHKDDYCSRGIKKEVDE